MSTHASPKAAGDDLEKWVAAALQARKSTLRPRVGFDELADAAGVSVRTAKRHFNFERRGATDPHIPMGPLYGYTQALRTTIDAVVAEAIRLSGQDASKVAQEAEAAANMTPDQHKELREAQATVKGRRASPRKQA